MDVAKDKDDTHLDPDMNDPANFIPRDIHAKILALQKVSVWTILKIPALFGIWFVCAAVAVSIDSLWIRLPCWIVIGFTLHGLGVFVHEAAHDMLFRKRWIDRLLGFLCGVTIFFPCSSYRATHMLHHWFANTDKDPDNLEVNFPNKWLRGIVFYGWLVAGMPLYILQMIFLGPFRAIGWKEKAACVLEPAIMIVSIFWIFQVAMQHGYMDHLFNGWVWALPFTVLVANFRGLAEHTQLLHQNPPDPFQSTRSIKSNRLVTFFFNNQNHHLEHHLFPEVPWNNLGRVHDLLQPVYEARQAAVANGYIRWILPALRHGPNRTMHYLAGKPVWNDL